MHSYFALKSCGLAASLDYLPTSVIEWMVDWSVQRKENIQRRTRTHFIGRWRETNPKKCNEIEQHIFRQTSLLFGYKTWMYGECVRLRVNKYCVFNESETFFVIIPMHSKLNNRNELKLNQFTIYVTIYHSSGKVSSFLRCCLLHTRIAYVFIHIIRLTSNLCKKRALKENWKQWIWSINKIKWWMMWVCGCMGIWAAAKCLLNTFI